MGIEVSCLTVTRPSRWAQFQRCIVDFHRQTLVSKELVAVVADPAFAAKAGDWAESYARANGFDPDSVIVAGRHFSECWQGLTQAQVLAKGGVFACWDDDDSNHPDRLASQLAFLRLHDSNGVVALGRTFHYFHTGNELFLVDYDQPNAKPSSLCAASTVMAERRVLPPFTPFHRDNAFAAMLDHSARGGSARKLFVQVDTPEVLHVVGVFNDNRRGESYHRSNAISSPRAFSAEGLQSCRDKICGNLSKYLWDADKIIVSGATRPAFEVNVVNRWPSGLYPLPVVESISERLA